MGESDKREHRVILKLFENFQNLTRKVRVRVRVRSLKDQGACASACGTFFEVRVCMRRTLEYLATH